MAAAGIAQALVRSAAAHARRRGHPALRAEVEAGNRDALAAWQAMGFLPQARQRLGWPWSAPAHVLRLML
ncbi:GNAT family N-acetyltransferase [Paracoccus thiocyanatus]|uniref:GNAT family N-acetyltransferase n=1 Tax=Paracoccus thiocyanatus TaxID=34006 RepID=UPI002163336A|nr:GNAT family N-acetyltransferase [Paracoccus thiocyanatus]